MTLASRMFGNLAALAAAAARFGQRTRGLGRTHPPSAAKRSRPGMGKAVLLVVAMLGVCGPAFRVAAVDFGSAPLGGGVATIIPISNTGPGDLTGLAVAVSGTNPADFTVGAFVGTTVAAGSTKNIPVTFLPTAIGARSAVFRFAGIRNGNQVLNDVNLTGTGLAGPADGEVDALYAANVSSPGGIPGRVDATAVQPDGKIILGGDFAFVWGVPRNRIARLNVDGSVDTTFNPNANGDVFSVAVQADGRILLGGWFTTLQPNGAATATTRNRIARLNADGTLDTTFNPNADSLVHSVAVQADGKILLAGGFLTLQPNGAATPTPRIGVARLNADGSLDTGFDPRPNADVLTVVQQPDGKILLGGSFTLLNVTLSPGGVAVGTARNYVARLNADGSLDTAFNPNANNIVLGVAVQADGKILLGGSFTTLQPNGAALLTLCNRIARLNVDGTLDTTFNPNANSWVESVAVQADGKILLGGRFNTLQPNGVTTPTTRNYIARLNADGSLDTGFDPNPAYENIYGTGRVAQQANGKILLGGYFRSLQPNGAATPTPRESFARLYNAPAVQTLTAPSPSQVVWQRGGAAPEVSQVTFELSVNAGASWTKLGNGTRVGTTANWQLTGLSLPSSGQLRARGRTTGGTFNGSSGLAETVAGFILTPAIAVEQPVGTSLADGTGSVTFGSTGLGTGSARTFTIRNTGTGNLTGLAITTDGAHAADFTVGAPASTTVAPGGTTTFTVTFRPGALGPRAAAIHITSNVVGAMNPFDLNLSGTGVVDTSPGSVDALNLLLVNSNTSVPPSVSATAQQPDGKTIIVGQFTSVLGVPRNWIARLNADGTLDTTFNPNPNYSVSSVAVQADGKIVLGGQFSSLQPNGAATATVRNHIARLNADGTLDTAFNPTVGGITFEGSDLSSVSSVAVQGDGKILVGGVFTTLQPNGAATATSRNNIARLNADGTLDTTFNPNANNGVRSFAVQADGKILLGGQFTTLQPSGAATPTTRNRFARLNADGSLDTGFNPNPNGVVHSVALQADGKILLGGRFTTLQPNGAVTATTRNNIARLNADGTLDTAFNPNANDWVGSVALQVDGKILLGGGFTTLQPNGAATATIRNRIARLNADGTLDTALNPDANDRVGSVALQADGKILLGGGFTTLQPNLAAVATTRTGFARLNNDAATQTLGAPSLSQVLWQRGGSAPEVSQVTFDLSVNGGATWTPLGTGTRVGSTANWQLSGLGLPVGGQLRARGRVSGGSDNGSSGWVQWVAPFGGPLIQVEQPDAVALADGTGVANFGSVTLGSFGLVKTFTIKNVGGAGLTGLAIAKDGAHAADFAVRALGSTTVAPGDTTTFTVSFAPGAVGARAAAIHIASNATGAQNPFDIQLAGTGVLDTAPGSVDSLNALLSGIGGGLVYATAAQPDGKTVIAGSFTVVMGVGRNNVARLNADGTLDTGFNPNVAPMLSWDPATPSEVRSVAVQADGKILLGGSFESVGSTVRNRVARLNADGSLDTGFNPNANGAVESVAVQANGKIVLGGWFTTLQPNGAATATTRQNVARLNADGTLDTTFNPNANFQVYCVAVQADGKILLGGYFTTLQPTGAAVPTTRNRIARLNADGTLDATFNPNANNVVRSVAVQADGQILFGGDFSTLQPTGAGTPAARNRIARLNADGTLDTAFDPNANGFVTSLAVQADGKILLGGNFTTLQPNGAATATPRNRIARLNADGSLDAAFNPNANFAVYSVAVQADGKILLGGRFVTLQPNGAATHTYRAGFARLNNDAATQTLSTPSASQVVWERGGTTPEVSQVTFEVSVNGGATWTSLGAGTRVGATANWQRTGLALPTSGQVRARGRTSGGHGNGSAGVVQTVAAIAWPGISMEQPAGTSLADGTGGVDYGTVTLGSRALTRTFTIRNTGTAPLSGLSITKDGAHAADFTVGALPSTTVAPGGTTTFTLSFAPGAAGVRTAAIHVASNVLGARNPFDLTLTGIGVLDTTPGSVDGLNALVGGGTGGTVVFATAVQPDGKTLLAGEFTSVLGVARNRIARLNTDGTLDTAFNPNANNSVYSVAVQADGRVLVGGPFTTLQPNGAATATARNRIARLNADGTLDTGFNPNANNEVYTLVVQADGKILVGGKFTTLQPNGAETATVRNRIARLNADGTLDTAFNPNANFGVLSVAVQADGKILLGGQFTTLQPNGAATATVRNRIARLNADGTLDTAFNPNPNPDSYVNTVAVQADGKILLGGWFTSLQPNGAATATTRNRIARVNADGTLDTGFNPNVDYEVYTLAVQADGKILLGGFFNTLQPNGAATATPRSRIARLNADGSLDTGFDPKANHMVSSLTLQADGKILLGGAFTTLQPNGAATITTRNRIARLNTDGTLDTTFNPNANASVFGVAVQADGKILLGGGFTTLQPNGAATATTRNGFARLNNTAATQTLSTPGASQVVWERGGTAPEVSQVTFELSVNGGATWTSLGAGTRVGTTANWQRTGLSLPTSGQVRARGRTSGGHGNASAGVVQTVAAIAWPDIAVEQPTGTSLADGTGSIAFGTVTVGFPATTRTFTIRNTGTAPLSGLSTTKDGPHVADFTVGALGSATVAPGGTTTFTVSFAPGAAGLRTAIIRIASNVLGARNPFDLALTGIGVLDTTPGSVDGLNALVGGSSLPYILATAVQADGKTLLAGEFTSVLGVARNHLARLNADGSLDTGFNPNPNLRVMTVAVQADGKILIGGDFNALQPNGAGTATPRRRIARLNADGSLDTAFNPNANFGVKSVAVQADGKILIGGEFTTLQPNGAATATARNRIARLNADGTLDTGFNPNANDAVVSVAVQADGKILIGGEFTTLQPNGAATATARNRIARLNTDGTLDTAFNPNANEAPLAMAVQGDGKILLGGAFTTLQPNGAATATTRNRIARLNADGTLDTAFNPNAGGGVISVAVQVDGKILLGGSFLSLQPNGAATPTARNRVARLNADGTLDTGFNPNANDLVASVAVRADGKILLGGLFTTLQPNGAVTPTARASFARLNNDAASQVLNVTSTANVLWSRAGSAPELSQVTFELSSNGGATWALLGPGTRVGTSAHWQRSGLTLPTSGQVRARGRTTGGYYNGSSGWVESVVTYSGLVPNIGVEQADGTSLADGTGAVNFGAVTLGGSGLAKTFTVRNTGYAPLTGLAISKDGTNPGDFTVGALGSTTIAPGATTTFTVSFAPAASGGRSAAIHIANNVVGTKNPYDLTLTGTGLVDSTPGSVDGLNAGIAGSGATLWATAVQPDGKTLLAGEFTSVLGAARNRIARLNADGTLDTIFNPNANNRVLCVGVQPDGKILLGGVFTTLQPNGSATATLRSSIARLNADGSLDTGFNPQANFPVYSLAVQADGKIVIGGDFTTLQPNGAASATTRNRIARLNADGSLDAAFNPNASATVQGLAVQADGKILLGGNFTALQPNGAATATARNRIARLNADGTLDTAFNPNANLPVYCVALQADGKILLGGEVTTLQPNGAATATARNYVARLNADGTLDTAFNPKANSFVFTAAVQADGKILLGGAFTTLQPNGAASATPRNYAARLNADGSLDTAFNPNPNNLVFSVASQADGKVLLGGMFSALQPNGAATATTRNVFAMLNNAAATQTLSALTTAQVVWNRGGTAPELSQVTFELSVNGGTIWTPLGVGTRVGTTANWQRTGLALPTSGQLRARGRTAGGSNNGSAGLVEAVTAYRGINPVIPPDSPGARINRLTWDDQTLRMEFEASTLAGSVDVWSAGTVDADSWMRLDLTPVRNPNTGQREFLIPTDPSQPQQFYRLEIHPGP